MSLITEVVGEEAVTYRIYRRTMSLLARALCTDTVRSLDIHNLQQHVSVENRYSQESESSFRIEASHSKRRKCVESNLKIAVLIWVIVTLGEVC